VILAERNGEMLGFAVLLLDVSRPLDRDWLWGSWLSLVRLSVTSTTVWARVVAAVARRLRRRPAGERDASAAPPLPDDASLYLIGVAPAARGLGLGRSLLRSCVDRAIAAGRRGIVLSVRTDNAAAIRLYEDAGFVLVGDSPEYHTRVYRLDLVAGSTGCVTPSAPDVHRAPEPRTAPRRS
jgi:ribosomal protein S18 acetylase RimI-like enzyme